MWITVFIYLSTANAYSKYCSILILKGDFETSLIFKCFISDDISLMVTKLEFTKYILILTQQNVTSILPRLRIVTCVLLHPPGGGFVSTLVLGCSGHRISQASTNSQIQFAVYGEPNPKHKVYQRVRLHKTSLFFLLKYLHLNLFLSLFWSCTQLCDSI